MNKKRNFLLAVFFIVFPISVFSESEALVLTYIEIDDEAVKSDTEAQIFKQLKKELERQNMVFRDESYVASSIQELNLSGKSLISQDSVLQLGKTAGVAVCITIEVVEKGNLLEFIATAWDINGEKKIASDRKISRSSITKFIMINSSIAYITTQLTGESGVATVIEDVKVRKITFLSNQDGLEIYMPDGTLLGIITNSVLNITDVEYEIGTNLLIKKKLKKHRTDKQLIILDSAKSVVPLSNLEKAVTLAFDMNWTYMQLMGIGAGIRFYPIPDWAFFSLDNYFYVQKDFSTSSGTETIHDDIRFLFGVYIGIGPKSIFRVSVSTGFGVILSYPIHRAGVLVDVYANAVNVSLEINLEEWSFYLRPELKIAMGIGDNKLHEGGIIISEYNVPAITIGVIRKW